MAETKKDALAVRRLDRSLDHQIRHCVGCLNKDREAVLAFCDFPAEQWSHLRKTNVSESSIRDDPPPHRVLLGMPSNKAALAIKIPEATREELESPRWPQPAQKVVLGVGAPKSSDRMLKPLPTDPIRHRNSAIARDEIEGLI